MSEKLNYLECWTHVAVSLLSQALIGEPSLTESLPKPMLSGSFGFAATIAGDEEGRFSVLLEGALAEATLLGEAADQKAGWAELLKEVADAAAGELLAKTGRKCQITAFTAIDVESKLSRAFQLKAGDHTWSIQVYNGVKLARAARPASAEASEPAASPEPTPAFTAGRAAASASASGGQARTASHPERETGLAAGLQLLLDVELEASLRFGAREMPLDEILDLGPGDVVQLDRHISDPVDLIVGDKIVARGDVVLVNGNFGLRVTEVAEPQRRLESIRCLF
jgi:flagellar motor switch protein FliN